jgi:hypothetical protein
MVDGKVGSYCRESYTPRRVLGSHRSKRKRTVTGKGSWRWRGSVPSKKERVWRLLELL